MEIDCVQNRETIFGPLINPDANAVLPGGGPAGRAEDRQHTIDMLLASNQPAGRTTIWSKFKTFWCFCSLQGWHTIPARPADGLGISGIPKSEGRVTVQSAPQPIAAISIVLALAGITGSKTHDQVVNRLQKAWKIAAINADSSDQSMFLPTDKVLKIAALGVQQSDPAAVRSALLIVLDMAYFSRADSCNSTRIDDLSLVGSEVLFGERRFKQKQIEKLAYR